jgi:hypothetical protein
MSDFVNQNDPNNEQTETASPYLFLPGLDKSYTGATRAFVLRRRTKTRQRRVKKTVPIPQHENATDPKISSNGQMINSQPEFGSEKWRSIQYYCENVSRQVASSFDQVISVVPVFHHTTSDLAEFLVAGRPPGE